MHANAKLSWYVYLGTSIHSRQDGYTGTTSTLKMSTAGWTKVKDKTCSIPLYLVQTLLYAEILCMEDLN